MHRLAYWNFNNYYVIYLYYLGLDYFRSIWHPWYLSSSPDPLLNLFCSQLWIYQSVVIALGCILPFVRLDWIFLSFLKVLTVEVSSLKLNRSLTSVLIENAVLIGSLHLQYRPRFVGHFVHRLYPERMLNFNLFLFLLFANVSLIFFTSALTKFIHSKISFW